MDKQDKLGVFPYIVASLSFVPLIGVLFGIIAITWGLVTQRTGGKKLVWIGGGGITFTAGLYFVLFYVGFVQRGGVNDELRVRLTETTLTPVVHAIEYYKVEHGEYPASLEEIMNSQRQGVLVMTIDPMDSSESKKQRLFYYERIGRDHYYLRSVGPDGVPFTSDDVVPNVSVSPGSRVGLLTKRPE